MNLVKWGLIFIFFWSGSSSAAECAASDARCKKLTSLVKLLGYETSTKSMMRSCFEQTKAFRPELMIRQQPKLFGNVTEKSKQWPRVISAYNDYAREFCDEGVRTAALNAYQVAWGNHLTNEQLDKILAFLNTSDGKAFSNSFPLVYDDVIQSVTSVFNEVGQKAYLNYSKKLLEITSGE